MATKTQKEKILDYLKAHGAITVKEMTYDLGITRGAARIKELIEDNGEPITRHDWKTVIRTDGSTTEVKVYKYCPPVQGNLFGNHMNLN